MNSSTHQLIRAILIAALATAGAFPAAAQFGGLKKKIKSAAGAAPAKEEAAPPGQPTGGGNEGGTIVLDDDVLERYLVYFRTVEAEREAAKKEDTPYGKYLKAEAAAVAAEDKCKAAQNTWAQRLTRDEKLAQRSNAISEKMSAALDKQDMKLYQAYGDSMLALIDPACLVKERPPRPDNWNDMQRQIDERAEKKGTEASGLEGRDRGQIVERAIAILKDAPGPDISQSEISAVKKREAELKRALGLEEVPPARASKSGAPAAADTAPPAPAVPQPTAQQKAFGECTNKNAQENDKEVKRLGEQAAAAAEAGNTGLALVYSDSITRIMQRGCTVN
jgi:hypothetical protein